MRAAIYTRLSRDREDQTSTKRQAQDCRRLAASRGWKVADLYEDLDVSAYRRGVRRPAYERLIADIEAGGIDAVVIWKIDRLARSMREFVRFSDLAEQHGVEVVSVNEPFDTGSPIGKAVIQMLAVFAELESATISMRIKSGKAYAAKQGAVPGGGTRAFGYTLDRSGIAPEEATAIREAAERVLAGDSLGSIARDWNARGLRTVNGNEWRPQALGRMLRSPHLAGLRAHANGDGEREVVSAGRWEAILDRAMWERVRVTLDPSRRRRNDRGTARRHLLSGFVRCGPCGARLVSRPFKGFTRYVCANDPGRGGCGRITISAGSLEALVVEDVMRWLDSPKLAVTVAKKRKGQGDDNAAADEITAVEAKLEELAHDWAADRISRKEWLTARKALEQRLDAAQRQFVQTDRPVVLDEIEGDSGRLRDAWSELSLERRRAVLDAVIDRVVVAPAVKGRNRFDPSRVEITYRG